MSSNQCCGNCRFWDSYTDEDQDESLYDGVCRRYPPVPFSEENPYTGVSAFAETDREKWCGEWQAENPQTLELTATALARQTLAGDLEAARALADRIQEMAQEKSA